MVAMTKGSMLSYSVYRISCDELEIPPAVRGKRRAARRSGMTARTRARAQLQARRYFITGRNGWREARAFCPCELCRLRFGRMLYPRRGGDPIRSYRRRR